MQENKKNMAIFAIVGILIFLVLVVLCLVGVLLFKQKDTDFGETVQTSESKGNGKEVTFVLNGYEFTVPEDYEVLYVDTFGVIVYMSDVFQMKTKVIDESFETFVKNPTEVTQASVDAGGTILQDVKEVDLNGKKYAYFRVDLSGDECFVVHTATPDNEKRIAAQIALQTDVTDEDMLQMFSSIAESATKTDKPDSTDGDIVEQTAAKNQNEIHGEMQTEGTVEFNGTKVTHYLPEGYYLSLNDTTDSYSMNCYYTIEPRVDVECSIYDSQWFGGIEGYIEMSQYLDDSVVETMEIEGNTVYYVVESFMDDGSKVQKIYAGIDLNDKAFYVVEAYVVDEDIELTMDILREFLVFK